MCFAHISGACTKYAMYYESTKYTTTHERATDRVHKIVVKKVSGKLPFSWPFYLEHLVGRVVYASYSSARGLRFDSRPALSECASLWFVPSSMTVGFHLAHRVLILVLL